MELLLFSDDNWFLTSISGFKYPTTCLFFPVGLAHDDHLCFERYCVSLLTSTLCTNILVGSSVVDFYVMNNGVVSFDSL